LDHERAVPGQDRVRLRHRRDLFQDLLPQPLADLSQHLALSVSQAHTSCDLVA
jgi:hypothetical protein